MAKFLMNTFTCRSTVLYGFFALKLDAKDTLVRAQRFDPDLAQFRLDTGKIIYLFILLSPELLETN
jgi:hypothetical protein